MTVLTKDQENRLENVRAALWAVAEELSSLRVAGVADVAEAEGAVDAAADLVADVVGVKPHQKPAGRSTLEDFTQVIRTPALVLALVVLAVGCADSPVTPELDPIQAPIIEKWNLKEDRP